MSGCHCINGCGKVSLDVIRLPFGITIDMGIISFIVTFVWIIGITNAVNLIDGLDGLSGGICAIILVVIACMSVVEARLDIETMSLLLAGSILASVLQLTSSQYIYGGLWCIVFGLYYFRNIIAWIQKLYDYDTCITNSFAGSTNCGYAGCYIKTKTKRS